MAHVAFLRSPHAHARILGIEMAAAKAMPGVLFVATAEDLAAVCKPMQTVMENAPDHISPPQPPLASRVARWQGEPVAAVVAETQSAAEDAVGALVVAWEPLPAVVDGVAALQDGAPVIHPSLGHNCALDRKLGTSDIAEHLARGDVKVEYRFGFNRHTGAPVESRAIVVDYDPLDGRLTVYQSTQVPHQTKDICARLLGIPEHHIRVICRDVGGGFGTKLHVYPDELATAALAKLLGRPLRFEAGRSESFVSDAHSREFFISARLSAKADGTIGAIDADMLCAAGAYSIYPRGSIGDVMVAAIAMGAPYRVGATRTRARVAYLNKVPTGSYRGVGHPIGCAVTEVLVDEAASALGVDPVEFRRRSYHRAGSLPVNTAGGITIEAPALASCLEMITERMDYAELRSARVPLA